MKLGRLVWAAFMLCASVPASLAAQEHYEIFESYETKGETSTGGSSSSRGRTGYVEHVEVTEQCIARTFDLIDQPETERPLAEWHLPATVTKCKGKERFLANRDEMEARLEAFLLALEATNEVCDKHYFTWNVFKIECDPEAVFDLVDHISLGEVMLGDGQTYTLRGGMGEAPLALASKTGSSETYVAKGQIDPQALREEAARAEVVVREIYGEQVSLNEALAQLSKYEYSGRFTVTVLRDSKSGDISRVVETSVKIIEPDGVVETRTATRTTERIRVGNRSSRPF